MRKAAVGQRRRHAYGTVVKINNSTKSQSRGVYRKNGSLIVGAAVLNQPTARNASATRASTRRLSNAAFLGMRTPYGHSMPPHIALQADMRITREA